MKFSDRSTSDMLVLMIAGTICLSVLGSTVFIIITSFINPEDEHAAAVAVISDTIQMLVSLLAGFIAGRTESQTIRTRRESRENADEVP
jgi:hypothetical protein